MGGVKIQVADAHVTKQTSDSANYGTHIDEDQANEMSGIIIIGIYDDDAGKWPRPDDHLETRGVDVYNLGLMRKTESPFTFQ